MEEALDKLDTGLSKKGTIKKHSKILERIGRLREKNQRVSQDYQIEVIADDAKKTLSALNGSESRKIRKKISIAGSAA